MNDYTALEDKEFSTEKLTESWDFFEVSVSSRQGWSNTNIQVNSGELLYIDYVSGTWNGDGGRNPYHGPEGPTREAYTAPENYPLPGVVEDSLVGKVGGEHFYIGRQMRRRIRSSGTLHMTINDIGYHDNKGSVTMRVSVRRS